MNKIILSLFLCILAVTIPYKSHCQDSLRFEKLPYTFPEDGEFKMANFNEDSLLDMLVLTKSMPSSLKIYRNLGKDIFEQEEAIELQGFGGQSLEIVDVNNDNEPDIFVSGAIGADSLGCLLFLSGGNLNFQKVCIPLAFNELLSSLWHDFNEDGMPDLFISGKPVGGDSARSIILMQEREGFRELETNLLQERITKLVHIADPAPTFYIQTVAGSTFSSGLYTFKEDRFTSLSSGLPDYSQSVLAQGDLNHDGQWDLFLSGTTKDGEMVSRVFFREENTYTVFSPELEGQEVEQAEVADINSDGLADLLVRLSKDGESKVYIGSEIASFEFSQLSIEAVPFYLTDYDLDGQIELVGKQAGGIGIYKNANVRINEAPTAPQSFLSIPLNEGVFLSWSKGEDDKTSSSSLSYDLMIKDKGDSVFYRSSLIDEETGYNKHFGYGVLGTDLVYQLNNFPGDTFQVVLSTFDNAHYTGPNSTVNFGGSPVSVCAVSSCFELYEKDTLLCQPIWISLNSFFKAEAHYWVSYTNGYLGKGDLPYQLQKSETLYGIRIEQNCIEVVAVNVTLPEVEAYSYEIEACEKDTLHLMPETAALTYHWFNVAGDSLGSEPELSYVAQNSNTLFVQRDAATSSCPLVDTFYVEVYPLPTLEVSQDQTIRAGEEVWLQAWGAEVYEWFPKESIEEPYSAVTTARSRRTTTYVVKAATANGCIQYDSVRVTVLNDLFIPSLFSPNADGKNDRLEISGSGIEQLKFQVYSQSGTLVFEAISLEEASRGWDGTYKGKPLPAGNLAWHIQGEFADGSPLQVASKSTGFITLIR